MKQRTIYTIIAAGGGIGLIAAFLQMLEEITLLKNAHAQLACNLNSVFSCGNVLNAWQSSVFGFPNALMCIVLFTIFGSVALAGATGGRLTRGLRLAIHGLSVFTLFFGLWFLAESTFVISSLCIFCVACFGGLIMVNWGWLRLNANDLPIGKKGSALLAKTISTGADTFAWIVLALVIAFVMWMRFA